ncbi:MAG: rhodanese-related sulfurtransferase [Burkholderiaceae bacterium]
MPHFLTSALYKFVGLPDYEKLREPLHAVCARNDVRGTLLLAPEGINGTIAGPPAGIAAVLGWLRTDPRLADLEDKQSWSEAPPFVRLKVRLKAEIVSLHVPGVSPAAMAGKYVEPEDWNRLLDDPAVVVVDTRNAYEVAIGSFTGALDPHTRSFSELPAWLEAQAVGDGALAPKNGRKPKVAMFCTGGIRCEKSTALLRMRGFDEVYHLRGGILKYLEKVPAAQSRWQGECFVFDERVSVRHGLQPGALELCRSCGRPLGAMEKASPLYQEGVSCAACHALTTPQQKKGFAERHRQVGRARSTPSLHIGARLPAARAGNASLVLQDPVRHVLSRLAVLPPGQRLLIGLAGLPGAGKSTLAARLTEQVNRAAAMLQMVALGMDGFHLPRSVLAAQPHAQALLARRGAPWTFDIKAFALHLRALRDTDADGVFAEQHWPGFEHRVGDPAQHAMHVPASARVTLIEGLYLLHQADGWQQLDGLLDECWYLDTPPALARTRLLCRHMADWNMDEAQARARMSANDDRNARIVRRSRKRADWLVQSPDGNHS